MSIDHPASLGSRRQRGVTTIAVVIMLLVILTLMVLFSTNVAFFEQRTTNSESRAQVTEQLAEYALNLSGAMVSANRAKLLVDTGTGWMATGTGPGWVKCPTEATLNEDHPTHPCAAERDDERRKRMYYYDHARANGTTNPGDAADGGDDLATIESLPYSAVAGAQTGALTGQSDSATARFSGTVAVDAVMCRVGYDAAGQPECQLNPAEGKDIAVTLVAAVELSNENARAVVKETWATVAAPRPSARVPLIASGVVSGTGDLTIVAAPNAGGYGVAASIWSPKNVDVAKGDACGAGGNGSVSSCHLGDYLGNVARENLKTTCAGSGKPCACPKTVQSVDQLSGHLTGASTQETYDILDFDGDCGSPSITFFPREAASGPTDDDNDRTDDSLFEYTFNVDYVVGSPIGTLPVDETSTAVNTNCPNSLGNSNCAVYALVDDFGATHLTNCSSLNSGSNGIFYVSGDCDLSVQVGSANNSVVVVVDGDVTLKANFFGMLFARSNTGVGASLKVTGNAKVFGSLLVEGNLDLAGTPEFIYTEVSAAGDPNGPIPSNVKFGKVAGSWLDSRVGI